MVILKNLLTTFLLFLFSITILRWVVIFAIMIVAIPFFFLIQIIKFNPQNLRLNIYDMPFPLVYMNTSFTNAYPYFRETIMVISLGIALILFCLYLLKYVFGVQKQFNLLVVKYFRKKKVLISLGILIFILLLLVRYLFIPVTKIALKLKSTLPLAKEDVFLLKENNFSGLEKNNKIIKNNLSDITKEYNNLKYLSHLPMMNKYYADGNHLIKASDDILSIVSSMGEIRGNLTVSSLEQTDRLIPKLNIMLGKFSLLGKELRAIDPNRYPPAIGKYKIRENIVLIQSSFKEFEHYKQTLPQVISQLPSILGTTDKPAHYLIVYYHQDPINPKIRYPATMGKIQLIQGKFEPEGSVDLSGYFKNSTGQVTQAVSFPDFKASILDTNYPDLTGAITVNGNFLEDLLKVTGPIQVLDKVFTANTDGQCHCSQIIKTLNEYSQNSPNEIIGTIFNGILYKVKSFNSQQLLTLVPVATRSLQKGDISFYFRDPALTKITTSIPRSSL